jgi:hypothetical protein
MPILNFEIILLHYFKFQIPPVYGVRMRLISVLIEYHFNIDKTYV